MKEPFTWPRIISGGITVLFSDLCVVVTRLGLGDQKCLLSPDVMWMGVRKGGCSNVAYSLEARQSNLTSIIKPFGDTNRFISQIDPA